jgi:hypothetical protein
METASDDKQFSFIGVLFIFIKRGWGMYLIQSESLRNKEGEQITTTDEFGPGSMFEPLIPGNASGRPNAIIYILL